MKMRSYRLISVVCLFVMTVCFVTSAFAAEVCGVCNAKLVTSYGSWEHRQRITEIRNGNEVWANYQQTRTVWTRCPKNTSHASWHGNQTRWLGWRFEYYTGKSMAGSFAWQNIQAIA